MDNVFRINVLIASFPSNQLVQKNIVYMMLSLLYTHGAQLASLYNQSTLLGCIVTLPEDCHPLIRYGNNNRAKPETKTRICPDQMDGTGRSHLFFNPKSERRLDCYDRRMTVA